MEITASSNTRTTVEYQVEAERTPDTALPWELLYTTTLPEKARRRALVCEKVIDRQFFTGRIRVRKVTTTATTTTEIWDYT